MAPARVEKIITGIDVGSSKVTALIAGQTADGALIVLGSGVREAQGVKQGCVTDIAAVDRSVREALEQAERVAGIEVQDVWIGFGGPNVTTRTLPHEEECGGGQIDEGDVADLLARARERAINPRLSVLHALPALYTIDGNAGVRDPVGMFADRLGVEIYLVETDRGPISNLATAVRAAPVNIRDVASNAMAAGLAVLSAEARDLGVAVVDMGASLTNIGLFAGNMLVGLATLPIGGSVLTDDIATEFNTRRSQAERIKCFYGSALSSPRDHQDQIEIEGPEGMAADPAQRAKITRAQLNAVIRRRLDDMMPQINQALKRMGYGEGAPRQIVLTGGCAELKGLAEYAQTVLGGSVRIGRPQGLSGLPDAHAGPASAVAVGLITHAVSDTADLRSMIASARPESMPQRWWQRLMAIWQQNA